MNADGSSPTNLTNNPSTYDFRPSWTPDGSRIVFVSNRSGNYDVWIMDAGGIDPQNLTDDPANDYDVGVVQFSSPEAPPLTPEETIGLAFQSWSRVLVYV